MDMGIQGEDDEDEEIGEASGRSKETPGNMQRNQQNSVEDQHSRVRQYSVYVAHSSYKVVVRPKGKKLAPGLIGMHLIQHGYKSVIDCVPKYDSLEIRFADRIEANNVVFDPFFEDLNIGIPADLVEVDCAFNLSSISGLDSWLTLTERGTGRFGDPAIKPVRVLEVKLLTRAVDNSEERVPSNTVKITFEGTVRPKFLCIDYLKIRVRDFTQRAMFCDKCQNFGHTSKYCRRKQKCGRCSESHKTADCNHPTINKSLCPSCNAVHGKAWLDCPYIREVEQANKAKQRAESKKRYQAARNHARAQAALGNQRPPVPPKNDSHFPVLNNKYARLSEDVEEIGNESDVVPTTSRQPVSGARSEQPKESYAFPARPRNIYSQKKSSRSDDQRQSRAMDSSSNTQRSAPKRSRTATSSRSQEPIINPLEPRPTPLRARSTNGKALRLVIIALASKFGLSATWLAVLEAVLDPIIQVLLPHSDAFMAAVSPIVAVDSLA